MFAGVYAAMQNLFYTSPHDQSLAEQLLPIGSYGQEPILNVCKLGRLQNDAAKSRLGHGFLQIGWWVGPSGNRAVFLRKFMKQSNLYVLLALMWFKHSMGWQCFTELFYLQPSAGGNGESNPMSRWRFMEWRFLENPNDSAFWTDSSDPSDH